MIVPRVIKAGLVVGGRFGRGVVLVRNGKGCWSNPAFVTLTGGSVGWQIGVQSTDLVLVFKNRKTADRLLHGKDKLTLGADAAVAAGPLGRQAEAGTDARLHAEIYSYSRSRGLFAGISLKGPVCWPTATPRLPITRLSRFRPATVRRSARPRCPRRPSVCAP